MGGWQMAQITSQEGDFELRGVTPGSYMMVVDFQRSFRQPLEVGKADIDGITIAVPPAANIEGRVRVEGQGDINLGILSLQLPLRDPMPVGTPASPVKPDGSFGIENLAPDTYDVNVSGLPAGYYLKSASLSGQDVLESGLTIAGGKSALDLVVSSSGGRLEGVVAGSRAGLCTKPRGQIRTGTIPSRGSRRETIQSMRLRTFHSEPLRTRIS
jgi:hypothetical protein